MDLDKITLSSISSKAIQFWWLLVIAGTLGGLFGFLASRMILPPIYSAASEISVQINFTEVGHLTQYEQDQLYSHLIAFVRSDALLKKVVDLSSPSEFSFEDYRSSCKVERQLSQIIFRCQNQKAQLATEMANYLQSAAYTALKEALGHAERYQQLTKRVQQLETCVERSAMGLATGYTCPITDHMLEELSSKVEGEKIASSGIIPGFTILPGASAEIPGEPIRHQTNLLVISGALIGLIIAFILSLAGKK